MDDSVIACDEIVEETFPTNFKEKKVTCKMQNFYFFFFLFLLITIALLIVVCIYCYLINIEQNKSVYYHFTTQIMN